MTRKKKLMITMIALFCSLVIAAAAVLTTAAVQGKRLEVLPLRTLPGVDENVQSALWYASLAANSHNAQAWKVRLNPRERRVEVTVDGARTLTVVDPLLREAYLSLGCYIHAMQAAFAAHGYETSVSYTEAPGAFRAVLTYQPREPHAVNTGRLSLIEKRHTDKSAYLTDNIDAEQIRNLLTKYPAARCYERGEKKFTFLQTGTLNAVKAQSETQAYRDELAEWLRFSDREATEKLDGIPAEMIGLAGIVKAFYYWTTSRESAAGDKFAEQGISTAQKQAEHCGAFFVITGGTAPAELVDAGRTAQAFWLDCAAMDIAIQPMSAMLETQPFSLTVQEGLAAGAPVQMILRAGYVREYGKNLGLRRNLADYVEVVD